MAAPPRCASVESAAHSKKIFAAKSCRRKVPKGGHFEVPSPILWPKAKNLDPHLSMQSLTIPFLTRNFNETCLKKKCIEVWEVQNFRFFILQDSDSGRMNLSDLNDPDETCVKAPLDLQHSPR